MNVWNVLAWAVPVGIALSKAGFTAQPGPAGFPLVQVPATLEEKVRFLKLRFPVPVDRHIYNDGCVLVPAVAFHRQVNP